jgi:transcriptional regulator with XRE-family HTH domain
MKRVGEKLRTLRERHGLSYRQLAAELGYDHSHLVKLESGKGLPSAGLIEAIVKYFGITYDELLDDEVELRRRSKS